MGKIDQQSVKTLERMREILDAPTAWVKGTSAVDSKGVWADPTSPNACRFCILGALDKSVSEIEVSFPLYALQDNIIEILQKHIKSDGWREVSNFNDNPETTHSEILNLLNVSIITAKEKVNGKN